MNKEQMAATAAHWWAKVLERPKFDNLGSGPRDTASEMASVMALVANREHPAEYEKLERFETLLQEWLLQDPTPNTGMGEATTILSSDYGPDTNLFEIATRAGIRPDSITFPWKTVMWIKWKEGKVRVSYGYRAPIEDLPLYEPKDIQEAIREARGGDPPVPFKGFA